MRTLIVYDSVHGNTELVAKTIADKMTGEVSIERVGALRSDSLSGIDLLVIGSPTHGGNSTPAIQSFLGSIQEQTARAVKTAAFDTRLPSRMLKVFGYAAPRISDTMKAKGCTVIVPPEGFFVKRTKGPLKEGELERAASWAEGLVK